MFICYTEHMWQQGERYSVCFAAVLVSHHEVRELHQAAAHISSRSTDLPRDYHIGKELKIRDDTKIYSKVGESRLLPVERCSLLCKN